MRTLTTTTERKTKIRRNKMPKIERIEKNFLLFFISTKKRNGPVFSKFMCMYIYSALFTHFFL